MIRKTFAALGTAVALTLALSGCAFGGGQSDAPAAPGGDAPAQNGESQQSGESQQDSGGSAAAGSDVHLVVDGATMTIENPVVACVERDGQLAISVGGLTEPADQGLGAILTTGDSPKVVSVGLVSAEGAAVAYVEGSGMGSASVTKTGNRYEITGEGMLTDVNNPTSVKTVPFEFGITCN